MYDEPKITFNYSHKTNYYTELIMQSHMDNCTGFLVKKKMQVCDFIALTSSLQMTDVGMNAALVFQTPHNIET